MQLKIDDFKVRFHKCSPRPEYTWVEKESDGTWTLREGSHPAYRDVTYNITKCPYCNKQLEETSKP